jgi:predicted DCC family thiol-disulfide oxidoreductase YuxK
MIETLPKLRKNLTLPILLFDDECAVCRRIAGWVKTSAKTKRGSPSLIVQPIGEDPKAIELLSPGLSIWEAYAIIHIVMPDGRLKLGGEAVAEVFRNLPRTRWLARSCSISLFGLRPFQKMLDLAYLILADVRPLLGCESCGAQKFWVKPIYRTMKWIKGIFGAHAHKARPITPIRTSKPSTESAVL